MVIIIIRITILIVIQTIIIIIRIIIIIIMKVRRTQHGQRDHSFLLRSGGCAPGNFLVRLQLVFGCFKLGLQIFGQPQTHEPHMALSSALWRETATAENHGTVCPGMTGYDRVWLGMTGYDRVCPGMPGYDRSWLGTPVHDRIWPCVTGYAGTWPHMTVCDRDGAWLGATESRVLARTRAYSGVPQYSGVLGHSPDYTSFDAGLVVWEGKSQVWGWGVCSWSLKSLQSPRHLVEEADKVGSQAIVAGDELSKGLPSLLNPKT